MEQEAVHSRNAGKRARAEGSVTGDAEHDPTSDEPLLDEAAPEGVNPRLWSMLISIKKTLQGQSAISIT